MKHRKLLSFLLAALMLVSLLAAPALASPAGRWRKDSIGWWYEEADGGYPAAEWKKIGGIWYYFLPSGYMKTGWHLDGGNWYYLAPSGAMTTGWQKIGGVWYYMNSSGAMVENDWVRSGGDWYYLKSGGAMLADDWMDGDWFDESGRWYDVIDAVAYCDDPIYTSGKNWLMTTDCYEPIVFSDAYVSSLRVGDVVKVLDYNIRVDFLDRRGDWLHFSDEGPFYSFSQDPNSGNWTLRGDNDYAASDFLGCVEFSVPFGTKLEDHMWKVLYGVDVEIKTPKDFFYDPVYNYTCDGVQLRIYLHNNKVTKIVHIYTP